MLMLSGAEELKAAVGQELGVSEWHEVTQQAINEFAKLTGDTQWIHVDPDRAANSPLGGTVAHGYYTLSLGPHFLYRMLEVDGFAMVMNYGLGRVRFPALMPVGQRVRMRARMLSADDVSGGVQVALELKFESEGGGDKPVCVAEFLARYFDK